MSTKTKLNNEMKLAFNGATTTNATIAINAVVTVTTPDGTFTGKCCAISEDTITLDTSEKYNSNNERIFADKITAVTVVTPAPDPFA